LGLLFRKTFLISLLLFPLLTFANKKVITSDVALFRVGDRIVFLSTYKAFRNELRIFRCFESKGLLLPALGLDKVSLKKLPSYNKIKSLDEDAKEFLKKAILLLKAKLHIEKQGRKYGKKYLKYYEKHRCLNSPYKSWPEGLQLLVTVELYFQERFRKGTSTKPLKNYDAKTWENVKFYLLSLDKKLPHNVFF
jgi:hypothetical protein